MVAHPGQRLKLCLAAHHGNCTPPRISPSCPFRDRSTNAGAVIARQIGHDLLSGRSDPLPTLVAAFMQVDLHRWIFALPPMSLPIPCLYKAHQRMYFSFWIFTLEGTERAKPFSILSRSGKSRDKLFAKTSHKNQQQYCPRQDLGCMKHKFSHSIQYKTNQELRHI